MPQNAAETPQHLRNATPAQIKVAGQNRGYLLEHPCVQVPHSHLGALQFGRNRAGILVASSSAERRHARHATRKARTVSLTLTPESLCAVCGWNL